MNDGEVDTQAPPTRTFQPSFVIVVRVPKKKRPKTEDQKVANLSSQKKLHDGRRQIGVCINNATHGHAVKGGRCKLCWEIKLSGERAATKAGRRRYKRKTPAPPARPTSSDQSGEPQVIT